MKQVSIGKPQQTVIILMTTAVALTQRDVVRGAGAGLVILFVMIAYQLGWFEIAALKLAHLWQSFISWLNARKNKGTIYLDLFDLLLGYDIDSRLPVIYNLEEIDTLYIIGLRGMGKTSLLHSLIHWLIKYHSPADLKLSIFDLKDGLDFRIYGNLPHLTHEIATNTTDAERLLFALKKELNYRVELFKSIPKGRLCNNLSRYHEIKNELKLDLPDLPVIVAIVDELHNISMDNKGESVDMLAKLIKEGRAYGVKVFGSTQQQKADMVPTIISSQFATMMIGYLADTLQYSRLGRIPKEVWERMNKVKGRFILSIGGDNRIIQANYVPEKELENLARKLSKGDHRPAALPELEQVMSETSVLYSGTVAQKEAIVKRWLMGFDERPNKAEFAEHFNVSERTYYNIDVPRLWDGLK